MEVKYELWSADDGYSFFAGNNESARCLLTTGAKLIWTVDASTWEEACAKQHEFFGWEPYKPMKNEG